MSNMMQTQDEISSTHDSPIAGSSNVFEVIFKTLTLTFIIIKFYKLFQKLDFMEFYNNIVTFGNIGSY